MPTEAAAIRYRREGFAGQRLVVLPPGTVEAARRHPLLAGLLPVAAGFFTRPVGHFVEREGGAPELVLIVCLSGAGWYWIGKERRRRPVRAGDVLLLPAGVAHAYGAADDEPWSIDWAHFHGTEARAWRTSLGLADGEALVNVGLAQAGGVKLDDVYASLEKGYGLPNLLAAAAALRVSLAEIIRRRNATASAETTRDAVERSVQRILNQLDRPVQLANLAAEAGLSVSHYSALFRAQTGFSPVDYVLRMRMQRAAQMLDTTGLRVEAIAERLGYADPYYFSRQFKRFMRQSPRAWRALRKC